jgi:hypothetical protein
MQATATAAMSHLRLVSTRQNSMSRRVSSPGAPRTSSIGVPIGP